MKILIAPNSFKDSLDAEEVYGLLRKFAFDKDYPNSRVSSLSGGEKARLQLMKMTLQNANFLVLDDPTANIDIHMRESLEDFLKDYEGTMLVASHDAYFLDQVTERTLELKQGKIQEFVGNYSAYKCKRKD